ncbi:MAG: dockerin [Chloroflexota bacterium]
MMSTQLIVDLSISTGPIRHGASGFLYGLGKEEVPSANVLAPLNPQVAAQKPEGGQQHPNGDALNVAETYNAADGREIEIYLQDVYAQWPYEETGLADYLNEITRLVQQVEASPIRSFFAYVPFNEPDQIWYNKTDKKQAFFDDWRTVFHQIKSLAPEARLVGPNFAAYDGAVYREFMTFAQQNDCLPEVISWHELNDDFFTGWYERYEDFRRIEKDLGLPPHEVCINEYGRMQGDLGVPGRLIQWMVRFENSKVDACLAYWTDAGSLNNLVTRDHYNRATGAWWLYRWYGGMTGNTVQVTPPEPQAEGLQGLATLDRSKKQVRVLLGGHTGDVEVIIAGFEAAPELGNLVHAAVWVTECTGLEPSDDPAPILEGEFALTDGQINLPLKNLTNTAAYQIIITPSKTAPYLSPHRYPAEYADLSGRAQVVYAGSASVECSFGCRTSFVVTAPTNGFYEVKLNYAACLADSSATRCKLRLELNGAYLTDISMPATATSETWNTWTMHVFLTAGINRIVFEAITGDEIRLVSLDISPGTGLLLAYEAESSANVLGGKAAIVDDPAASGGKYVHGLGDGEANFLTFEGVHVPQSGLYRLVVHFANAEFRGEHGYNSQVVDQYADVQVNDEISQRYYFRNTFAWDNYQSRVIDVCLQEGNNRIRFFAGEPGCAAPHIDKIEIAAPF